MRNILVSDIMTRDPNSVKPDTNLLECAKKMVRKRTGSLLLVDRKKLKGIICQKDILWALIKKRKEDLPKIKAIDISPRKIATIKPHATVEEAVNKMKKLRFERLPVIQNGELEGILTVKDILNFYPHLYNDLNEFSKIKDQTNKLKRVKKVKGKNFVRSGVCEECGRWDVLYKINGLFICETCRDRIHHLPL
jgi:CBS domain-containing protein